MKTENSDCVNLTTLIIRAKSGDYRAFEQLVDYYRPTLSRQCYRKLRNLDDVQDAIQEASLKAFKAIHRFDTNRPFLPWLQRICSNCCIDLLRDRQVNAENLDDHLYNICDQSMDIQLSTERGVLRSQIMSSLQALPKRYSDILRLRHFEDLEVNEIASKLNRPEGTIKSWLFRARALLRKELSMQLIG